MERYFVDFLFFIPPNTSSITREVKSPYPDIDSTIDLGEAIAATDKKDQTPPFAFRFRTETDGLVTHCSGTFYVNCEGLSRDEVKQKYPNTAAARMAERFKWEGAVFPPNEAPDIFYEWCLGDILVHRKNGLTFF